MDRKVKPPPKVDKYRDIPPRQRWVYYLSEYSVGKLLLGFIFIFWIALGLTFLFVKVLMRLHK
jgi:hypothetical protein